MYSRHNNITETLRLAVKISVNLRKYKWHNITKAPPLAVKTQKIAVDANAVESVNISWMVN